MNGISTRSCRQRGGYSPQRPPATSLPPAHSRVAAHSAHLEAQARPSEGSPRQKDASSPQKKATQGELTLVFLDECGFSPSQPVSYSWTLKGQRKHVSYENPQNRRVNVLAGVTFGPVPSLRWTAMPRTFTGDDVSGFIQSLGGTNSLTVVVVDNAPIHQSKLIKDARKALIRQGIVLYYLPPYSPELNLIEPMFGVIKHHELSERSYTSAEDLMQAVNAAFITVNQRLSAKCEHYLRPVA